MSMFDRDYDATTDTSLPITTVSEEMDHDLPRADPADSSPHSSESSNDPEMLSKDTQPHANTDILSKSTSCAPKYDNVLIVSFGNLEQSDHAQDNHNDSTLGVQQEHNHKQEQQTTSFCHGQCISTSNPASTATLNAQGKAIDHLPLYPECLVLPEAQRIIGHVRSILLGFASYIQALKSNTHTTFSVDFITQEETTTTHLTDQLVRLLHETHRLCVREDENFGLSDNVPSISCSKMPGHEAVMGRLKNHVSCNAPTRASLHLETFLNQVANPVVEAARKYLIACHVFYKINYALCSDNMLEDTMNTVTDLDRVQSRLQSSVESVIEVS